MTTLQILPDIRDHMLRFSGQAGNAARSSAKSDCGAERGLNP